MPRHSVARKNKSEPTNENNRVCCHPLRYPLLCLSRCPPCRKNHRRRLSPFSGVYFPASSAIESDELSDTVNYAEVYEVLKKEMDIPSKLLEHVVGRILNALGSSFPILTKADCTLTKVTPPIPSFQSSGVSFSATALYR